MKRNCLKVKEARFTLSIRKQLSTVKIVRLWHRFFREAANPWRVVQGQVGWDMEQPWLLECVTAHVRGGSIYV